MDLSTRRLFAAAAPAGRLFSLLVLLTAAESSAAPAPVGLGVVLDLASDVGRKSLTCISMALDDFYLKHPSYGTRVKLSVRDTHGDLFTTAQATEELMDKDKNGQVQAIIFPQTSPEAEIFASITERSNIPILSSSVTSPASSSPRSRLLVRTAPDISSQVTPIAAILEAFPWRAAVLLHEDSPYGISLLSFLVHAFQESCSLTDSLAVPVGATDDILDSVLYAVKTMSTRVFIVHMLPALAARLFRRAMMAGMMSKGYVWIATAGFGDAADRLPNPDDIQYMQGVVSLRPYVQATDQVRSFSTRFKVRFLEENQALDPEDPDVPVSLLWLYDTAWAAAAAAKVSYQTAPLTLLDALLTTKFDGLTGRFRLVDRQRQVSAYEIVNIIGKGARTVGFWTPESGISTSLYPKSAGKELKQIIWPTETAVVPLGRTATPNGRVLRVAVPVRSGFPFMQISTDASGGMYKISGYFIDVCDAAMKRLDYPAPYRYELVNASKSYEELVNLLHEKKVDLVAGDVTITPSRVQQVSFTVPFTETGCSMVVAEEGISNSNSMWIFVKPLTPELWLTSLAFFLFTGFVVWEIEHRINPRFRGTPLKQFGTLLYFIFSTMVFAHREKLESNLSKLVVIMWVFVVLILTTSYTANLTSMLTVRQLQPQMNIWTERDYLGVQEGSYAEHILTKLGIPGTNLRRYTTMDQYADALKKGSDNGGVKAIFDEVPYLKLFLSRYCEGYSMSGPVYRSGGFGFMFPIGSPMMADVSRAILELTEENELTRIEDRWLSDLGACVQRSKGVDDRIGLWKLGGLFLTSTVVSCLMLLIHLSRFVSRERMRTQPAAGAVRWLHAWLRRFHAFVGRRGEPGNNGSGGGAMELNHHSMAAGATEQQQGGTGDSDSTPMHASDSASAPVPDEISAPAGSRSRMQSVHEPAAALASM